MLEKQEESDTESGHSDDDLQIINGGKGKTQKAEEEENSDGSSQSSSVSAPSPK